MPEVSVIIPVYNTQEEALRKCLDSVLNQEYTDLEVIAVDDGSKNNAPAVLDEYAAKDSRMIVIHKENGGVSKARNTALAKASGTYIQFMDSDDYIPDTSTKELVRAAKEKNVDLVVGQFYRVIGDNLARKGAIETSNVMTLQEYAECMMIQPADYYYGVLWNKLYHREIIMKYNVRMDESLRWCEDFVFNLEYLLHVKSIYTLSVPVYYYIKTEGSLVAQNLSFSKTVAMKWDMFRYYDDFYKNVLDKEQYQKERLGIASFVFSAAVDDPVIPMAPGTMKVGEEEVQVHFHSRQENLLTAAYYIEKLYEKYLRVTAAKYDLDVDDLKIAGALKDKEGELTFKDISDYTGLNQVVIVASLEKMMRKGLVAMSFEDGVNVTLTEGAKEFSEDLDRAISDVYEIGYKGMSKEEIESWEKTGDKVLQNLRKALVK